MARFKANSENIGIFRILEKFLGENIYAFQSYPKNSISGTSAILDRMIDQPILDGLNSVSLTLMANFV